MKLSLVAVMATSVQHLYPQKNLGGSIRSLLLLELNTNYNNKKQTKSQFVFIVVLKYIPLLTEPGKHYPYCSALFTRVPTMSQAWYQVLASHVRQNKQTPVLMALPSYWKINRE